VVSRRTVDIIGTSQTSNNRDGNSIRSVELKDATNIRYTRSIRDPQATSAETLSSARMLAAVQTLAIAASQATLSIRTSQV
jgi:hypothetical protein